MFFSLVLFSVAIATGQEIFENSTLLCERCTCKRSDDAQIFILDCQKQGFHHILSTWPPHNATIIANFAENDMETLDTLPPTDAVVEVTLTKCNIEHLYPGLFDGTKNIKMADLSYNFLTADEISRENFMGPYHHSKMEPIKLEDLNLAHNQIHSLNKNVFEFLPNLKRLNLKGNNFVVLDIHTQMALSSITGLVSLNLADNELTELVKNAIENFKNLVELDLSTNELDFVPRSLITVGQSLEVLILDENPIIELNNHSFEGLNNLNELSANKLGKIKEIKNGAFASMPKLRKLSLSNNPLLENIDEEAFTMNQTLQEVYFSNNKLSSLSYKLLQWSNLSIFELKENPLVCSCDLYNITSALSRDITRNEAGPYCLDPRSNRPLRLYELKSDICTAKPLKANLTKHRISYHHFSIPLAGLIATLVLALFVAIGLGYGRYRRFLFNKNYQAASRVLYNPLPTTNINF